MLTRRAVLAAAAAAAPPAGAPVRGRGQSVFLDWRGDDDRTRACLAWVGERMQMLHDVTVRFAGDDALLPVGRLAVSWRRTQMVFVHDSARLAQPPRSMAALAGWAALHPGRLTHLVPADPLDAPLLVQALLEFSPDRAALARLVTQAAYAAAAAPLWSWYGALRPNLWRGGREFPADAQAQAALLAAGEIDLFAASNPGEAAVGIAHATLPPTARACVPAGGSVGGYGVAVIRHSPENRAAARLLAGFLLSPEAQAHAAHPHHLGSPTVLDLDLLWAADRARFAFPDAPGLLGAAETGRTVVALHPSWTVRVAADWRQARS